MRLILVSFVATAVAVGCSHSTEVAENSDERQPPSSNSGPSDPTQTRHESATTPNSASSANRAVNRTEDWPSWRGPHLNGIADEQQPLPTEWSETENVIWKSPVPGRGHSSPIVVGDRIYLATADDAQQQQAIVAFERGTGTQIWMHLLNEGGFPKKNHPKNTNASPTAAWDGERVIISFYHHGGIEVIAVDRGGETLWKKTVGPFDPQTYQYGYAPSPLIYKSTVIVAVDSDQGGYLVALNREIGDEVWRTPRPKQLSFSSPIVASVASRDQLLISGCYLVSSYDPANGKKLWDVEATTMATCGTMVWDGDLVFASGGYPKNETVCLKADGSGDIVWSNQKKCYEQSMLAHNGYVYAVDDNGVAFCWKAEDGTEMWSRRLGGKISASPILANGNIYQSNERGTTFVFKADPQEFTLVAENRLGNDTFATPAICGGRIYLRVADSSGGTRQESLYCLGLTGE